MVVPVASEAPTTSRPVTGRPRSYPVSYTHLDVYKRQLQCSHENAGFPSDGPVPPRVEDST